MKHIKNGNFAKNSPISVIVELKYRRKIIDIYRYIIQSQIVEIENEEMQEA